MRDASICGLGQTAPSAIESAHRPSRGVPVSTTEGLSIRRKIELEIDGETVVGVRGHDDPAGVPRDRDRDPDALLRRDDHPEERVSRLHGRGRGLASARAVVLTQGRGRDGRAHRQRARPPQPPPRARAPRLVGRPLAHRATSSGGTPSTEPIPLASDRLPSRAPIATRRSPVTTTPRRGRSPRTSTSR